MFHYAISLNEEWLKDMLEGGDKEETKAAVQETLGWLEANTEMFLFSRAPTTRARCLEHASRALHGLLGNSMGLVGSACEAEVGIRGRA